MAYGGGRVYTIIGDGTIWSCHPYDANSCLTLHKDTNKFLKYTYMEYVNGYVFYSNRDKLIRCEPMRAGSCRNVDTITVRGMVVAGDKLFVKTPTQVHICDTNATDDACGLYVREVKWEGMSSMLDMYSRMVYAPGY
jgi:hypothetical protein